jgi:hypothetical protein
MISKHRLYFKRPQTLAKSLGTAPSLTEIQVTPTISSGCLSLFQRFVRDLRTKRQWHEWLVLLQGVERESHVMRTISAYELYQVDSNQPGELFQLFNNTRLHEVDHSYRGTEYTVAISELGTCLYSILANSLRFPKSPGTPYISQPRQYRYALLAESNVGCAYRCRLLLVPSWDEQMLVSRVTYIPGQLPFL